MTEDQQIKNFVKRKKSNKKFKQEEFTILDDFNYSTDNNLYNKLLCIDDCEFKYYNFLSHTTDKKMLQEFLKQSCGVKLNHEKNIIKNIISEYAYRDRYKKIIDDLNSLKNLIDGIIFVLNKLMCYFTKINILNVKAFSNLSDDRDELNYTLSSYIKIMHDYLDTVVYNKHSILKTSNNIPFKICKSYKLNGSCNNVNITLLFPSLNIIFNNCINLVDSYSLIENTSIIADSKKIYVYIIQI